MNHAVIRALLVALLPFGAVSFRPSCCASRPVTISRSTMLGSMSEDAAWLSISTRSLHEKPDVVSCLAPDIEDLLKGDTHSTDAYSGSTLISTDGEITLPPVEDEGAAAEPALVDALSWSALKFALDGSLRSSRMWQTSPHHTRLEVLEAGLALQAADPPDDIYEAPGEALSCGRLLSMAVGLAEIEMALQRLCTHDHEAGEAGGVASDRDGDGGRGRMLLKDLLVHTNVQARLPRGLHCVLQYLFLPCGLNLRNLVWHGFVDPPQLHRRHAALLLLLLLNIHTPGRRSVSPPDRAWRSQSHPQLGPRVASLYQYVTHPHMRPTIQRLVRTSGFILPGAEALVCASWEWYASGRPLAGALGLILVLEQSLRRAFALCNGRPRHFFARSKEYYATLDGFGQRDRHQLLLAARLVADTQGDESQQGDEDEDRPMPGDTMNSQKMEATVDEAQGSRDSMYTGGEGGVENLLLLELGVGHVSCLLDLFLLDNGPGLRSKLAHGGVDALSLLLPHNSCHASRLLLLLFLSLATHYHPSDESDAAVPPAQDPPPSPSSAAPSGWAALESCHRLLHGAYRSAHHPRALLSASLHSAVAPMQCVAALLRQRSWRVEDTGTGKECTLLLTLPALPPNLTSNGDSSDLQGPLDSSPVVLRVTDRRERFGVWMGQEDGIAHVASATYAWAHPLAAALHHSSSTQGQGQCLTPPLLYSIQAASIDQACGYLDRMWPSQPSARTSPPPPPPAPLPPLAPPHLDLSELSDVLCPAPPLHACALQITSAVGSTAWAFVSRLRSLEALVFHRQASSTQRRLYVQTLYVLPAVHLYLSACLLAVDYHVMAATAEHERQAQPLSGKRLLGRRTLPALLNELLSFRRSVLWPAAETGQQEPPSSHTSTVTRQDGPSTSPPPSTRDADTPAPPDDSSPQQSSSAAPPPSFNPQAGTCRDAQGTPKVSTAPRQRKTYSEAFAGVGQLLARLQAHEDGLKPRKKKAWM